MCFGPQKFPRSTVPTSGEFFKEMEWKSTSGSILVSTTGFGTTCNKFDPWNKPLWRLSFCGLGRIAQAVSGNRTSRLYRHWLPRPRYRILRDCSWIWKAILFMGYVGLGRFIFKTHARKGDVSSPQYTMMNRELTFYATSQTYAHRVLYILQHHLATILRGQYLSQVVFSWDGKLLISKTWEGPPWRWISYSRGIWIACVIDTRPSSTTRKLVNGFVADSSPSHWTSRPPSTPCPITVVTYPLSEAAGLCIRTPKPPYFDVPYSQWEDIRPNLLRYGSFDYPLIIPIHIFLEFFSSQNTETSYGGLMVSL